MDATHPDAGLAQVQAAEPPTTAAFAPASYTRAPSHARQRSTILVQQKSPLLVATPPQITRALAYSHPFLLPLNKLVGLLSWTTGDAWESFLLLCAFWALTLYGDDLVRFAGPVLFALVLIVGIWSRRYSPASSTGRTSEAAAASTNTATSKPTKKEVDGAQRHHKSLDDIVDNLKLLTSRCNILLDPWIQLVDFLSTQRTATSATTRPALTSLFLRILLVTPVWVLLTLHPINVVSTRRVVLVAGTIFLSWHSRTATVSRAILWRSHALRQTLALVTGLTFKHPGAASLRNAAATALANRAVSQPSPDGLRLTWTVWENQRRWIGIGWTASMLAYERASWTDDALNPAPAKDDFALPTVEGGVARWRWVPGSQWHVASPEADAAGKKDDDKAASAGRGGGGAGAHDDDDAAWVYYDNKWHDARRADGWGRYTRRRKWMREAELVEVGDDEPRSSVGTPAPSVHRGIDPADEDSRSTKSKKSKTRWFRRRKGGNKGGAAEGEASRLGSMAGESVDHDGAGSRPRDIARAPRGVGDEGDALGLASSPDDDGFVPMPYRGRQGGVDNDWGVGDDAGMELG